MRWWIGLGVAVWTACGGTTAGSAGTAGDSADDAQVQDVDAGGDAQACPTPTPTTICCEPTGKIVPIACIAGGWQCPPGTGDKCDIVTDVVQDTDAADDDAADIVDATDGDAGGCDADALADLCCCQGDMVTQPVCKGGQWQCPGMYYQYSGAICFQPCGPCSLPCADTGPDTGPETGPDTGPDASADDTAGGPEGLCTSTGGSVYTGSCCAGASDFPNECAVGACSCPPQYLKDLHRCACPSGQCFDPQSGCH